MNILKAKRIELKYTRKYVSKMTNLPTSTIKNLESGNYQPIFKNLLIYCRFLNISLDEYAQEYLKQNEELLKC